MFFSTVLLVSSAMGQSSPPRPHSLLVIRHPTARVAFELALGGKGDELWTYPFVRCPSSLRAAAHHFHFSFRRKFALSSVDGPVSWPLGRRRQFVAEIHLSHGESASGDPFSWAAVVLTWLLLTRLLLLACLESRRGAVGQ